MFGLLRRNKSSVLNKLNISNKGKSYTPTINKQLVSYKSASFQNTTRKNRTTGNIGTRQRKPREKIIQCTLQPTLKININGICQPYTSESAKKYLLKRLSRNKHVDISLIITPKQASANCWFNTMFVSFFISDKGRKFFHFLRQLMIEGRQIDGQVIPTELWDGFSLLNFAIEASLSGTKYAYKLNTNIIISQIYKSIPDNYKNNLPFLTKVGNAGNPLRYYMSLMYYLENTTLQLMVCETSNPEIIREKISRLPHIPHIIIIELFEGSRENRPLNFIIRKGEEQIKYKLDSSIVRNISKEHFCAMITCEGEEMGYDGISHSRMVPMKWKEWLNTDTIWKFKGNSMKWSFLESYQMLYYYRV